MEQEWVVIGEANRVKPTNKKIILNHFSDLVYDKKIIKNPFLITDTFDQESSDEDFFNEDSSNEDSSDQESSNEDFLNEDSSDQDSYSEKSFDNEKSVFSNFQHQNLVKNTVDYLIGQSYNDNYKDTPSDETSNKDTSNNTLYDVNINTFDDKTVDSNYKNNNTIISEIIENTKNLIIRFKNEFLDKPLLYGFFLTFSAGQILKKFIYLGY